jgi:hypothetical protein
MNTDQLIEMAEADKDILAAILFGGSASGCYTFQSKRSLTSHTFLSRNCDLDCRQARIRYFDKLSGKVLTPQMVEKLKEMRRFSNVMVHRYDKVDDIRVYYVVWNRIGDLYEFKEEVPRVFEERGFITGYLVGDVGLKWQGLAGAMVNFTLLFWARFMWDGGDVCMRMCNDAKCGEQNEDEGN